MGPCGHCVVDNVFGIASMSQRPAKQIINPGPKVTVGVGVLMIADAIAI